MLERVCFDDFTCKELLLRVEVDDDGEAPASTFLETIFRSVTALSAAKLSRSRKERDLVIKSVLRMVAIWSWECEGIVKKMFTSPAILSAVASVLEEVKENAADDVGETKSELCAALLVASCIWTSANVQGDGSTGELAAKVTKFVDNVVGVQRMQDLVVRSTRMCGTSHRWVR